MFGIQLNQSPTAVKLNLVEVYSGGLNSADQNTNAPSQIYAWDGAGLVADQGLTLNSNTTFTATQSGVFQVAAAIEVSNGESLERSVFLMNIIHLNNQGHAKQIYSFGSAYIRTSSFFDKAASGGSLIMNLLPSEGIQVTSRLLYAHTASGINSADASLSRCIIHRLDVGG